MTATGACVATATAAQTTPTADDLTTLACPQTYTCLEYQGALLQLDPEEGPYQLVITAEVTTTTTTFTEETEERSIVAAGFAQGEDGVFTFDREYQRPRSGVFADVELGDVLGTED